MTHPAGTSKDSDKCDCIQSFLFCFYNRVFPTVDHSDNDARIVLDQLKFSKKVTSNRT